MRQIFNLLFLIFSFFEKKIGRGVSALGQGTGWQTGGRRPSASTHAPIAPSYTSSHEGGPHDPRFRGTTPSQDPCVGGVGLRMSGRWLASLALIFPLICSGEASLPVSRMNNIRDSERHPCPPRQGTRRRDTPTLGTTRGAPPPKSTPRHAESASRSSVHAAAMGGMTLAPICRLGGQQGGVGWG